MSCGPIWKFDTKFGTPEHRRTLGAEKMMQCFFNFNLPSTLLGRVGLVQRRRDETENDGPLAVTLSYFTSAPHHI